MADISTLAHLIDGLANRSQPDHVFRKTNPATVASNQIWSWWLATGFPTAGAAPGAAAVPTKGTQGSLVKFTNPGGGEVCRLQSLDIVQHADANPLFLYDRLVHHGGESGTDTSLRTVNTPAITRGDVNGIGVLGFVECYSNLGGASQTLTVTYTNTAGTGSRTVAVTIPATYRAGRLLPILPLQGDDIGIKSIETIQLGGSTGTVGSYGVTLARRISTGGSQAIVRSGMHSGLENGYPKVESDACLWLVSFSPAGTIGSLSGGMTLFTTG